MNKQQPKPLKDLNLLDRFLFSEAMDDPQFSQDVISIILGKDFQLDGLPQTEKEQRNPNLRKYVRLDVWMSGNNGDIVDAEVQQQNTKNLPRRSRYYQGMIDSNLIEMGDADYNKINNVYVIMIAPFDLFGMGKYKYTFKMICEEERDLELDDGAIRIFLNTHGKDEENISPELKELLMYFENSCDEVANQVKSEKIKNLHSRVSKIKYDEELEVKYMREWEERVLGEQRAKAEGIEEEKLSNAKKMKELGIPIKQIIAVTELSEEEIEVL